MQRAIPLLWAMIYIWNNSGGRVGFQTGNHLEKLFRPVHRRTLDRWTPYERHHWQRKNDWSFTQQGGLRGPVMTSICHQITSKDQNHEPQNSVRYLSHFPHNTNMQIFRTCVIILFRNKQEKIYEMRDKECPLLSNQLHYEQIALSYSEIHSHWQMKLLRIICK